MPTPVSNGSNKPERKQREAPPPKKTPPRPRLPTLRSSTAPHRAMGSARSPSQVIPRARGGGCPRTKAPFEAALRSARQAPVPSRGRAHPGTELSPPAAAAFYRRLGGEVLRNPGRYHRLACAGGWGERRPPPRCGSRAPSAPGALPSRVSPSGRATGGAGGWRAAPRPPSPSSGTGGMVQPERGGGVNRVGGREGAKDEPGRSK